MDGSNLVYVIPPYLLNTSLGSKLQKAVEIKDKQLSLSNSLATTSPRYVTTPRVEKKAENRYSSDPVVDKLIQEKLVYKLAISGVLGVDAMENAIDETYLYELFKIFKYRFMNEGANYNGNKHKDGDEAEKDRTPLLDSTIVGETKFLVAKLDEADKKIAQLSEKSLKELMVASKYDTYSQYKTPTSFIKFSDGLFFDYPLPVTWSPLIPNKYFRYVHEFLNLQVTSSDGYSTILLSTKSRPDQASDPSLEDLAQNKSMYYNFIGDKQVFPSAGIFYYETEILQECTAATNFTPLLQTADTSISSNSATSICVGFATQNISYETSENDGTNIATENEVNNIDLEELKNDILLNDMDNITSPIWNDEVRDTICHKPGEFKGSFAFNFEDLAFYNSIKSSESAQRLALLNMNRRLSSLSRQNLGDIDTGKLDLGVLLSHDKVEKSESKHLYSSDVVGCGINFVERVVFLTLNGVLVKTISNDELKATSNPKDYYNLFSENYHKDPNSSVFPLLGFKLDRNVDAEHHGDPTTLKVKTNLGFKEFEFDINNYVNNFHIENQKFLYMSLLERIQHSRNFSETNTIEKSLLEIDNPTFLIKLIKGYLNHEGYLETFNSFNFDLNDLSKQVGTSEPLIENSELTNINNSQALNRQVVRKYILQNQFELALKFLSLNYGGLLKEDNGCIVVFKIKTFQLIYSIKKYLETKFNLNGYEFEFEYKNGESEQQLFDNAFSLSKQLQDEYHESASKVFVIQEITSALIVKDSQSLANLPRINELLMNYPQELLELSRLVNSAILKHLGFNEHSKLEQVFKNVDQGINKLSLKYNDEKFFLVNFERDYMDL